MKCPRELRKTAKDGKSFFAVFLICRVDVLFYNPEFLKAYSKEQCFCEACDPMRGRLKRRIFFQREPVVISMEWESFFSSALYNTLLQKVCKERKMHKIQVYVSSIKMIKSHYQQKLLKSGGKKNDRAGTDETGVYMGG